MEITQQPKSTIDEIRAEAQRRYEYATNLAITARDAARDAVVAMADVGALLEVGWDAIRGGANRGGMHAGGGDTGGGIDWVPASRDAMAEAWGIARDHAAKAVYLHRNREQLELDLWPQDIAKLGARFVGLLPPPGSADSSGPERSPGPQPWIAYAGKLHASMSKLMTNKPVDQWRADERDNVKKVLTPIVELWQRL